MVSHAGEESGLDKVSLIALVKWGWSAVRCFIQKFCTWSTPGAFQLDNFLVVKVRILSVISS